MNAEKQKRLLRRQQAILKAQNNFYCYCLLKEPDFYRGKPHLKSLCDQLQAFVERKLINPETGKPYLICIIELPPRHGKTRTLVNLCSWLIGKYPKYKILTSAYNDDLACDFSKYTRNIIAEEKNIPSQFIYNDIFPEIRLKQGEASAHQWAIEGSFFNFKSSGKGGTITGKGGNCFPYKTKIITDNGYKYIGALQKGERVLSFNHESNLLEWKRVRNTKSNSVRELKEITFVNGNTIRATRDHKIYINGKGYVKAKDIKIGWEGKIFKTSLFCYFKMCFMWERIFKSMVRIYKTGKKKAYRFLLLQRLFAKTSFYKKQKKVQNMREAYRREERSKELYRMLGYNKEESKNVKKYFLFRVWRIIQASIKIYKILFNELQKRKSFKKNEGNNKSKLETRERCKELSNRVLQDEKESKNKRWLYLSILWFKERFANTSYRQKPKKQRYDELNNTMFKLPCENSQIQKIKEIKLKKPILVYDIQIEDNNNFFANNILVHNCLIVDDPVKSVEDAFNSNQLEKDWQWYAGTWSSRKEAGALEIVNHTPWARNDIGGRLQAENKDNCYLIRMPAMNEDGSMLCESILSKTEYESLKDRMKGALEIIFEANYNLNRIDIKGLLYGNDFKTYSNLPKDEDGRELTGSVKMWGDTADQGSDYLCCIWGKVYKDYVYVIDIYYTKDNVEITIPEMAKRMITHKTMVARFEGNAGGHAIGHSVKNILNDQYNWQGTVFDYFNQTKNKESRILSNSANVKEKIIFPIDWNIRFPEFYRDVTTFLKEGKNKNDDAPDTLTQIVENTIINQDHVFIKRR